tara:strand:- start:858 stop:1337 length:480 start_codon:yes stop_codon:yes gene_type:complete
MLVSTQQIQRWKEKMDKNKSGTVFIKVNNEKQNLYRDNKGLWYWDKGNRKINFNNETKNITTTPIYKYYVSDNYEELDRLNMSHPDYKKEKEEEKEKKEKCDMINECINKLKELDAYEDADESFTKGYRTAFIYLLEKVFKFIPENLHQELKTEIEKDF